MEEERNRGGGEGCTFRVSREWDEARGDASRASRGRGEAGKTSSRGAGGVAANAGGCRDARWWPPRGSAFRAFRRGIVGRDDTGDRAAGTAVRRTCPFSKSVATRSSRATFPLRPGGGGSREPSMMPSAPSHLYTSGWTSIAADRENSPKTGRERSPAAAVERTAPSCATPREALASALEARRCDAMLARAASRVVDVASVHTEAQRPTIDRVHAHGLASRRRRITSRTTTRCASTRAAVDLVCSE
jgi:hypothetical protein